jgi:hypothetical protein
MVTYSASSNDKATPSVAGQYFGNGSGGVAVSGWVLEGSYGVFGTNAETLDTLGALPGSPKGPPALQGGAGVYGYNCQNPGLQGGAGVFGYNTNGNGVVGETGASNNNGVWGNHTGNGYGVFGSSASGDGVHGDTSGSGTSGVAGVNSGAGHGVYGTSKTGNAGHFDGPVFVNGKLTVQVDIELLGADCAEEFAAEDADTVEPGTVMVVDQHGALRSSRQPYDKKVAGVISGAGEYRPGLILDRTSSSDGRVPVALIGKVYCKVDAQHIAIEVGDLLTTSHTPGHAMKAADPHKAFGAVIGKALRPLESGQGLIPILVALQ